MVRSTPVHRRRRRLVHHALDAHARAACRLTPHRALREAVVRRRGEHDLLGLLADVGRREFQLPLQHVDSDVFEGLLLVADLHRAAAAVASDDRVGEGILVLMHERRGVPPTEEPLDAKDSVVRIVDNLLPRRVPHQRVAARPVPRHRRQKRRAFTHGAHVHLAPRVHPRRRGVAGADVDAKHRCDRGNASGPLKIALTRLLSAACAIELALALDESEEHRTGSSRADRAHPRAHQAGRYDGVSNSDRARPPARPARRDARTARASPRPRRR